MERRWHVRELQPGRGVLVACTLRPGWCAVGSFLKWRGQLRLAELTIVAGEMPPEADPRPSGESVAGWVAERRYLTHDRQETALPGTAEPHSIHVRLLREVPLEEMARRAREAVPDLAQYGRFMRDHGAPSHMWQSLAELDADLDELSAAKLDYLRAAVVYASMPANLKHPRAAAAAELGISGQQVSDRLRWARHFGYLTSPGAGRAGGSLTDLGAALAARHLSTS